MMIEIEEGEKLIDYYLTVEADVIVEVDSMEKTAIGYCESPMNLYVFTVAENIESLPLFSIVIADSEEHGIKVFFLQDLNADNLLPVTPADDTSEMITLGNMQFDFPAGSVEDFENALRIVNSSRLTVGLSEQMGKNNE